MGYPNGTVVQLLLLTGQRRNEIARLAWSEIDLAAAMLLIPASRMKGGVEHAVPLAPMALEILKTVPKFTSGDYLFSNTGGRLPIDGFGKLKLRVDKLSGVTGWVLYDLRRTARSHFSALIGVQDPVPEMVIAHVQSGVRKIYYRHSYINEKRDCLEKWAARLTGILKYSPNGSSRPRRAAQAASKAGHIRSRNSARNRLLPP